MWDDIEYGPAEEWDANRPASENRLLKMGTTVRIAPHPVNAYRSGSGYVNPEFLHQWSVCLKVSPKNEGMRACKAFMLSWLAYHKMTVDYFRAKAKVNSARESVVDPVTLTWWRMLETKGYLWKDWPKEQTGGKDRANGRLDPARSPRVSIVNKKQLATRKDSSAPRELSLTTMATLLIFPENCFSTRGK
jgi:hypothetical protein